MKCEMCENKIIGNHPYTPNDNIFCNKCSDEYFKVRKSLVEEYEKMGNIKSWDEVDKVVIQRMKNFTVLVDGYNCSKCGASQADIRKKYSNYCSNCGTRIKERSNSE